MVDILLSTYNGEKYLKEQLDSIINQTYKDIHIIVRDDASTDNTVSILKDYKNKYQSMFDIHLESNNIGCKESFFDLIKRSSGEYVMLCDQDDIWLEDKVEKSLNFIREKEKSKPALVYTDVIVVDENLKTIRNTQYTKRRNPNHTNLNKLLFSSKACGMTMIMNRKLLSLCIFPNDKRIEMHDVWLEYISTCFNAKYYMNETTALYRQHSNNLSGGVTFYNPITSFMHGLKNAKQFINRKRSLASVFLECYGHVLNREQNEMIKCFINLHSYNFFKRIHIINRYKFSTGFLLHYLSLLFF